MLSQHCLILGKYPVQYCEVFQEPITRAPEEIRVNFYQSFKKCSILTPDIRKQPQTSLESI